ncbi:hypothetical protein AHF37_06889 [Paragonimus kellicotti]|nr:hypothetical protein AHF37_06889 [Paragonimus kellicotti]
MGPVRAYVHYGLKAGCSRPSGLCYHHSRVSAQTDRSLSVHLPGCDLIGYAHVHKMPVTGTTVRWLSFVYLPAADLHHTDTVHRMPTLLGVLSDATLVYLPAADLHHTDTVHRMPTKAEVQQILSVLDTNKDGKVSVDELKAFLDSADCKLDKTVVQQFIGTHDRDKDGKLDLNELAICLSQ